ncbi:transcription elongation factor GreA [bacterium]|nr:MAG: transcription elongation factor GreA [bacterium]
MANDFQVTAEGLERLKAELDVLRGETRMRIAEAIREAKSHGDLKENAAYHEAKLNQTRLEKQIGELERAVQYARVIERTDSAGAQLGSKVKLLDLEFDDEFDVELVGAFDSDPAAGRVSISSPMGDALAGKEKGAEIEVDAPAGKTRYRVLDVAS